MIFDHLVTFVELVAIGNFSKTAEHLKIAPSTLSRKIQELETHFGKVLITRDTRNFSLTTEGETLYQRFKSLPNQLAEAKQIINPETITDNYATLKIVLPVVHALEFITPYIAYFSKAYPEIKLNLFYMTWGKIPHKDVFDIAITVYPDKSGKFDQKVLRSEFVQLYCTPSYAAKYGIPQTIEDLKNHHLIGGIDYFGNIMNYPTFTNKYTSETFIYHSDKDNIKMNSAIHTLKIGLMGEHIFPSWSYLCDELVEKGELIQIYPEYYALKTDFLLLTRKSPSHEIQLFVDFIHRCMNRMIQIDKKLSHAAEQGA